MLDRINDIKDLKKLNIEEKTQLATEIRKLIIDTVSKCGGHLASNLGVVELTIALHSVFNAPEDKIIWDVGHQTYVHKILTGRKNRMDTLRKMDGLAGFPKTEESEYDAFDTGHSSTSISVALGMARARDLTHKSNKVVAVIGDGALTGGMALEALNDAGSSKTNLIVILNDNEMSISKNVGGMSLLLGRLRTKRLYKKTNSGAKKMLSRIPIIGAKTIKCLQQIKRGIKQVFISNMYFEDIGFTYFGPVDGHDIEKLESIMKLAYTEPGPVIIHVITKKGKGYEIAERNPGRFHGTSGFDIKTGESSNSNLDYSKVFGKKLVDLALNDKTIVAVTAAMCDGTGLSEFSKKFPDRFFDVGIAEQHSVGLIAGMAKEGLKPVLPLYSSFLQRAYDQVVHDICIQSLPVTICIDRAGIVGSDGETHQGLFDLCFLSSIPNINIMAPKDFTELENMLEFAIDFNGPIAIRYPKGTENPITKSVRDNKLELGKAEIMSEGNDITIIAIGKMVARAMEVAEKLKQDNISAEVINVRFLKPLDEKTIIESINKTNKVACIEDGYLIGGLNSSIERLINEKNIKNIFVKEFGYPDKFIKQGSIDEIEQKYGLDTNSIYKEILKLF